MMKTRFAYGVLLVSTLLTALWGTAGRAAADAPSSSPGPVAFITRFYRDYLNASTEPARRKLQSYERFFSGSAAALLERDERECAAKVHDGICGFGADGDVFLDAQESDPRLDFGRSGFSAKLAAPGVVEASFYLWPAHQEGRREMRFLMVQNGGDWRVDDLIVKNDRGAFDPAESMRAQIAKEIASITESAKDLNDDWVSFLSYIELDQVDGAARFVRFPVEFCEKPGSCKALSKTAPAFADAVQRLNRRYKAGAFKKKDWGKNAKTNPKEGDRASYEGIRFEFAGGAWWITRIDPPL
jgi:hypothetical protein